METAALTGGFAEPARDAARGFRAALDAMARPGTIGEVAGARAPSPISVAAEALCLVLLDAETPVWLGSQVAASDVPSWLTFHTGAPLVTDRAAAAFALGGAGELLPAEGFARGTPSYPDRSATLILEVAELEPAGDRLTGPGIAGTAWLTLPPGLAAARASAFPLGLDVFLTCGSRLAALPRSTRIG